MHERRIPAQGTRGSRPQRHLVRSGSHHGVAILARDVDPIETRRNLPGDSADREARYIEAAVNGVLIGCLYLPNGNPQPGPKFAYKLDWFQRLIAYAGELKLSRAPVVLAGDYNVVPTDADIYAMRSWRTNALVQPEPRAAFARLVSSGATEPQARARCHAGVRARLVSCTLPQSRRQLHA